MTEPAPPPAAAPDGERKDTNYILSQQEFRDAMAGAYRMHGETQGQISRTADAMVSTAGWVAVSLAFWLLLVGYCAIRGELRRRP